MEPFGPFPGMISRDPQGRRFDHSRLGMENRRFRLRHPNSGGFRPRMMMEMEQPPHAMPVDPYTWGQPRQCRQPPPFLPLQRPPFGSHFYHPDQMNSEFNQDRFNNNARHFGPGPISVGFRPHRFAPYPRPDLIRRSCDEVPAWRPPFIRPEISSCFAPPCKMQPDPAALRMSDWRLPHNNDRFRDTICENAPSPGVFRHFQTYSSPLNGHTQNSPFNGPLSEIQQSHQVHGQGPSMQFPGFGPDGPHREECCFTQDEPAEDSVLVTNHDTDNAAPECDARVQEIIKLNSGGDKVPSQTLSENKAKLELQRIQPSPELEKAIKLFIERHIPPSSPTDMAEVRDNFYYIGDFLQVSVYGNCSSRINRGVNSPGASFGICFKKGNELNCSGLLKTDHPQTPMAAELLAAERAILLAKHKVRTDAVTIITESSYMVHSVEQWKERIISSKTNCLVPETWMEVKHANEIQRLCMALDGMKVKWTLGDLRNTQFRELQLAKKLSVQCDDVIQDLIDI